MKVGRATRERNAKRKAFIEKHAHLCASAFAYNPSHEDWKSEHGRQLVAAARAELGFASSTANSDIFYSLYRLYKST